MTWPVATRGTISLPSGRVIRGRSLRQPAAGPEPDLRVVLHGREPASSEVETMWIRWHDFWLPSDEGNAYSVLQQAWERSMDCRVEVACSGGIGRTGAALACIAIIDGVDRRDAVEYVRAGYHPRAVETPWQRRYVQRFSVKR